MKNSSSPSQRISSRLSTGHLLSIEGQAFRVTAVERIEDGILAALIDRATGDAHRFVIMDGGITFFRNNNGSFPIPVSPAEIGIFTSAAERIF